MQQFKAKDKITQKMTRDGVVETNKATEEQTRTSSREAETDYTEKSTAEKVIDKASDSAGKRKAAKENKQSEKALNRENPHLHFSEEERADPDSQKAIRKSEKAADRLDKAKANIPKQKRIKAARHFDEATGRAKTRLYFEERDKPPNGKFKHNPAERPIREVTSFIHGKVHEVEKDNSGVEGSHKTELLAERAAGTARRKIREGIRSQKLKPYRELEKAQAKSQKADINYLYQKTLKEHPEIADNFLSHFYQKQKIKLHYARDLRAKQKTAGAAGKTAKAAKKTAKEAANGAKNTTDFFVKHWKLILLILAFLLLFALLSAGLTSCSAMFEGGLTSIIGTSYTAEDEAIREVEADYKALESELREEIENIETDYPDYDEYQYHLDEIGHNPFELASYLTAKLHDYTRAEAQAEIQALFEKQYTLTLREEVQTRYRTETTTEEVPYDYYILHVTLTNKNISTLAGELLTPQQKEMFDIYMETKGNKPDVFGENIYAETPGGGQYTNYEIPPDALSDGRSI